MTPTLIDLTGNRYGLLVVLGYEEKRGRYHMWRCQCDCGTVKSVTGDSLRQGDAHSCGCNSRKACAEKLIKYGRKSSEIREYRIWQSMKARCKYRNRPCARTYIRNGITVCERWQAFENFMADMGPCPSPEHSIDRIDNSKGYSPENCRWATIAVQARNRGNNRWLTFNGVTKTICDWATELGLDRRVIASRIDRDGWSVEKALTQPLRRWPKRTG